MDTDTRATKLGTVSRERVEAACEVLGWDPDDVRGIDIDRGPSGGAPQVRVTPHTVYNMARVQQVIEALGLEASELRWVQVTPQWVKAERYLQADDGSHYVTCDHFDRIEGDDRFHDCESVEMATEIVHLDITR